jgi:hypothetical protein
LNLTINSFEFDPRAEVGAEFSGGVHNESAWRFLPEGRWGAASVSAR